MVDFEDLVDELARKIKPGPQTAGDRLLDDAAVELIDLQPGSVSAGVEDGRYRYRVHINWYSGGYSFSCSCGAAKDFVCAHVWATAVLVEEAAIDEGFGRSDYYAPRPQKQKPKKSSPPAQRPPRWKQALKKLTAAPVNRDVESWPAGREINYVIDLAETQNARELAIEIAHRERKKNGDWSKPKATRISRAQIASLPDGADRTILAMLAGAETNSYGYGYGYGYNSYGSDGQSRYRLTGPLAAAALPAMCGTGRCLLRGYDDAPLRPQAWGAGAPWQLRLDVARNPAAAAASEYLLTGALERDGETRPLNQPLFLTAGGLVLWGELIETWDPRGAFEWAAYLRQHKSLRIPQAEAADFSRELYTAGPVAALTLPEELRKTELRPPLQIHLKIHAPTRNGYESRLRGELTFDYAGHRVDARSPGRTIPQPDDKQILLRDDAAEAQAHARFFALGWRTGWNYDTRKDEWTLAPTKLAKVVAALVKDGWHVQAEGKLYRQPGETRVEINSGIDWFELHAQVRYGDQVATLPQLLAALKNGSNLVELGDGTFGMLPEDWIKKYATVARMGNESDDHLRFKPHQAGLLDALLAAQPEVTCDALFENTRQTLRTFAGITPAEPPATFRGALRAYQKDSLGWFDFLRKFSFGGILADDMGLGKTVQVLAMLASRRTPTQDAALSTQHSPSTSLIVVPRSLIFNWIQEAKRFTPTLKVLDHSHAARTKGSAHFKDYDVVLTTYGTLRNDVAHLKDVEFDYAILDEAQAIKNASSESAKAARLLTARHRLALSGTPVQNHLGDLWSLFEFLNPGMLGAASVFSGAAMTKAIDPATRELLARALRPFILRRTKEQVAKDLPEKLEQTIYCELEADQRKAYDELKQFYRAQLLDLVAKEGINKAKIQILEALLRLRQAACHPGLIDKSRTNDPSAKLDTLLPRLAEIAEEGHKALVFSQFTSFLSIVKKRLDKQKIKYEYLDGKTRDRQARVDHFQSDPDCKLFLISLKAGGVGLNLTAADYVFLLDPWWNPAAEAQAIDRTHRIGQTRQVFACRLIAKDTVEEKVVTLQQSKRELAEAIIGQDNSVISTLGREELELLLS